VKLKTKCERKFLFKDTHSAAVYHQSSLMLTESLIFSFYLPIPDFVFRLSHECDVDFKLLLALSFFILHSSSSPTYARLQHLPLLADEHSGQVPRNTTLYMKKLCSNIKSDERQEQKIHKHKLTHLYEITFFHLH
jgi:hypothetical protein